MKDIEIKYIINIAAKAGNAIMEIYNKGFDITYKKDKSPITEADKRANEIICSNLRKIYPEIPLFSEENNNIPYKIRNQWNYYWLIDPLDGTKEFIKKNGEFTVNIALMNKDRPIKGVIYAPALNLLYYAESGKGAYRIDKNKQKCKLPIDNFKSDDTIKVVYSKSHSSVETENFIDDLYKKYSKIMLLSIGSSLKICQVAEGTADIYPRFAATMEWDIAAGDVIASESRKKLIPYKDGKLLDCSMRYNKENLTNCWFVVKDANDYRYNWNI